MQLLLSSGADVNKINTAQLTALDVAVTHGYMEIVELLIINNAGLKFDDQVTIEAPPLHFNA